MTTSQHGNQSGPPLNSASIGPLRAYLSFLAILSLGTLVALAVPAPQTGGIVPTEYSTVGVGPGPEPDVTFFATGDTMGKIEPCG